MDITRFEASILYMLQDDATTTIQKMSETTGRSMNACWRKVRQLEERGFILKRRAVLNPDMLNASLIVILRIQPRDSTPASIDRILTVVKNIIEIRECYRLTNSQEVFVKARVRDLAQYQRLLDRFVENLGADAINADFVSDTLYERTELSLPWQIVE